MAQLKFIYQPLKPYVVNQPFGANNACVSTDGLNKVISCNGHKPPKGYKSLYGSKGHDAVDLRGKHGQEVYCALEGVIASIDTNPRTGLDVRIVSQHNGKTYRHIYEHLLGYDGKVGDLVKTGQLVGWLDNTGWSSGDHLHFEFQEWKDGQWTPIDPEPLMFNIFARDQVFHESLLRWVKEFMARHADNFAYSLRSNK